MMKEFIPQVVPDERCATEYLVSHRNYRLIVTKIIKTKSFTYMCIKKMK